MNPDLTPPDEPLDDAARARIRHDVLAGLAGLDAPRRPRRWLVPVAAAAAVVAVAASTAIAVSGGHTDGAAPADTTSPTATGTTAPAPTPSDVPTTTRPPRALSYDTRCAGEHGFIAGAADVVARSDDPSGSTTFNVAGDRWQLCTIHGDIVTLHRAQPLGSIDGPDGVGPYRVSEDNVPAGGHGYRPDFVAGGPVPQDARDFQVTYTFPDGHVVPAVTIRGSDGHDWWLMDYPVTEGILLGDAPVSDPIHVEITQAGIRASQLMQTFDLRWGTDTCAQINHGC